MAFSLQGGSIELCNLPRAGETLVIGIYGGSNVTGFGTGTPWASIPVNFEYYATKNSGSPGTLSRLYTQPSNPGISCGFFRRLAELQVTRRVIVVEHSINGSNWQTWQTAATGEAVNLIGHFTSLGVRPHFLISYLGSNDAKSPATATAAYTNARTTISRYRSAYGGATGEVMSGCHIDPVDGVTSDLDLTDTNMFQFVNEHVGNIDQSGRGRDGARTAMYVNMRDLAADNVSGHLTGGLGGGSDTAGARVADACFPAIRRAA